VGATLLGAGAVTVAASLPASAETYVPNAPTQNSVIVGTGSATTYDMMQSLDALYNNAPGCNITTSSFTYVATGTNQQLNFSCLTINTGPQNGQVSVQVPGNNAYYNNPYNDVALSESPLGSSNGIAQIEQDRNNSTTHIGNGNATEDISYADYSRSSRDPSNSKDIKGLNFVAYATDGVTWLHWLKTGLSGGTGGSNSCSSKVHSLTETQLYEIWDGSIWNWAEVGGCDAPIVVYSGQTGSGTSATWKTDMEAFGNNGGFDPGSGSNQVNCTGEVATAGAHHTFTFNPPAGTLPSAATGITVTCAGPNDIFENELTSVNPSDEATAIFFYSWGKYQQQCQGIKSKQENADKTPGPIVSQKVGWGCGGALSVGTTSKLELGQVAECTGTFPSTTCGSPVQANAQTILGGQFPITRDIYNVYNDGSNSNLVSENGYTNNEATPATLNFVSEVGFLCKPQTTDLGSGTAPGAATTPNELIDPATSLWYETEIDNNIVANGFIPIRASATGSGDNNLVYPTAPTAEDSGVVGNGAYSILSAEGANGSAYTSNLYGAGANPTIPSANNPTGYCVVSTTDTNSTNS